MKVMISVPVTGTRYNHEALKQIAVTHQLRIDIARIKKFYLSG